MKKFCAMALCAAAAVGATMLVQVQPVEARAPYKKQFDLMYVKKDSTDPTEKMFAAAAEAAKCNICHVGEKKKDRNVYGQALAKIIMKNEKDPAKIDAALAEVAKEHSKPGDAASPTFGDLIKEGKLPGGE